MLSTLLALHLLAASQLAEPPASSGPLDPTWYGWQTLIADGTAAVLVGTGTIFRLTTTTGAPGNGFLGVGIGLFVVGAPTVHGVHANLWGALGSFGVRILGLLGGTAIGGLFSVFAHGLFTGTTSWVEPAVGAALGGVFASVYDAQRLAWQPVSAPSTASLPRWTPFAGSWRGAPMAGVAGVF